MRERFPSCCFGKRFLGGEKNELVSKAVDEIKSLKVANEDLSKQVEGLQKNRFDEVEELVYLRWVNACLRYELRHYQAPSGKTTARNLNKSASPISQATAKRLVEEYTGNDAETVSSHPSFPRSHDFDNDSNDSSSSRFSSPSKRPSRTLSRKLKRLWKSEDDFSTVSSPAGSIGGSSVGRTSISGRTSTSKGPSEAMILRNTSDGVAITSFDRAEHDSNAPAISRVASSFKLISKSVEGALDERYAAYMDRRKLALERWRLLKKKAYRARAKLSGDASNLNTTSILNSNSISRAKEEIEQPVTLKKPKLTQMQEDETVVSDSVASDSDEQPTQNKVGDPIVNQTGLDSTVEKQATKLPRPPPKPSVGAPDAVNATANLSSGITAAPPRPPSMATSGMPPPPPPPGKGTSKGPGNDNKVHRVPELVEFYHSLMRREAKKDTASVSAATSNASDAKNNMIEEIENKSSFLTAVKKDVETQGDFIKSLAKEVRTASFANMQDVLSFVNWLDEELSVLVDERAVLKHFEWPEAKADTLREAAFEYQDIMKLEKQASSFADDPKLSCDTALKKMYSLLEKIEHGVYALLRTRDMATSKFKENGIPVDWLSDSGVVGKIKLLTVKLAKKYMKRVASELDAPPSEGRKEPNRKFLLLQGVRFAFRVHQFAGGFDAESMQAFEELRSRVSPPHTNR